VFDACRNNPFERAGTRAVAGGGGLAPMTQLPEGVFSVFSAGPRQTALDRSPTTTTNPNSVFTRTFAKELTQPGENLVQVAQRTRRLVSEMAETVKHKQIPVYFDQMVDDVFLNGMAKAQPRRPKPAEPPQKVAALPPVQRARIPQNDSVNAPIAMFSRHNGGWTVVFSIADPTLGISWRMGEAGDFRETGFMDTLDPRTRKRMPNPSIELPADAPAATIQVRYVDTNQANAGAVSDPLRSGSRPDPRPAQDPRHDRDELAVVPRIQRAAGLLHASDVVSLRDPRSARRHRHHGARQGAENAALRSPGSQRHSARRAALSEARAATKSVSVELTYRDGSVSEIKSFRRCFFPYPDAKSSDGRGQPEVMDARPEFFAHRTSRRTMKVRCCIVGGGPAGMMLGYLLGRAGVDVVVLEKHADFFRDFRGDTVHPSTLQVMDELGLIDGFLKLPHQRLQKMDGMFGGATVRIADLSRLNVKYPFIAFMPQWDFLNFLRESGKRFASLKVMMSTEATI
jgi:hypothetical protein